MALAVGKETQKINMKSEKEEETHWNMKSKKEEETEEEVKKCGEDIAVTDEPWHWKLTPRNQSRKMKIKS